MHRIVFLLLIGFTGVFAVAFSGCGKPSAGDKEEKASQDINDHNGHDHSHDSNAKQSGKTDMEKMKEGLAGLSEEDRESASKQHFCPVSGEMLGTMGKPVKVSIKNKDVWICCDGCKKDIESDPDKYLAKLKQ